MSNQQCFGTFIIPRSIKKAACYTMSLHISPAQRNYLEISRKHNVVHSVNVMKSLKFNLSYREDYPDFTSSNRSLEVQLHLGLHLAMARHGHKKAEVLVARSKRTGTRYPIRTSHLGSAAKSWTADAIYAERLHYLDNDKYTVCRCDKPMHLSRRQVQNAEIEHLCLEFFAIHSAETTCSRDQWRAIAFKSAKVLRPPSTQEVYDSRPASRITSAGKGHFEYDSLSVVELVAARERQSEEIRDGISMSVSSVCRSRSKPTSINSKDTMYWGNEPRVEDDIPENVWRVSRPSVYLGQYSAGSSTSTPLGSSIIPAVQGHCTAAPKQPGWKTTSGLSVGAKQVRPPVDTWYGFSHSPGPSVVDSTFENTKHSPRHRTGYHCINSNYTDLQVDLHEIPQISVRSSFATIVAANDMAELPCSETVLELDAVPPRFPSHHSSTLRELEGRSTNRISELPGSSPVLTKSRSSR